MNITNKIKILPWHETSLWANRPLSRIDKIIIHQELADGDVAAVNKYHITPGRQNHLYVKGAPHFAYHFGIEKDGEIVKANRFSNVTWHTKDYNSVSIGIMVVGNFTGPGHDAGEPTDAQLVSIEELVDYLINKFKQLDKFDVYGHADFGKKACPGNTLMEFIEDYKT